MIPDNSFATLFEINLNKNEHTNIFFPIVFCDSNHERAKWKYQRDGRG